MEKYIELGKVIGPQGPQGPTGPAGADGKSAYQSAVEAGYSGTETAFNTALKEVPGHIANGDIHVTAEQKTAWNGSVRYDAAQTLTDAQKTQARENIAAGSAADLAKKPDAVQGNITLHVAKTGNDTTGDGSESKPYLTIQKALNSLPKLLLARADIVIHGGTYEEAVLVYGFSGANSLTIEGTENETVKIKTVDIRAVNLAEAVQLRNVELVGTSEDGYNFSVRTVDSEFVVLENVSCTNATASSYLGAFRFDSTLFVRLTGCTISNKAVALDVAAAVVYMNSTVTGTGNTVGIRCGSGWGNAGGYVQKGGANIAGEEQKGFGGQIW